MTPYPPSRAGTDDTPILAVRDVHVSYPRGWRRPPFQAVRGVSLDVAHGETVGVVGESGSGKSTVAAAVLGIRRVDSGSITFGGKDVISLRGRERRALGRQIQAVFQDPYTSLNPVRTVGDSIAEPLYAHEDLKRREAAARVADSLRQVGLNPDAAGQFPAEFSGGQRQRIAIARALICSPSLIVCDEPVSSLDVSVQAQTLNVLTQLQRTTGCSFLFISHNLTVVRHFSHRVIVLYRGEVMEEGPALEVCDHPQHPYTRALLAAVAVPDPEIQRRRRLEHQRSIRSTAALPGTSVDDQCPFTERCPHVADRCRTERPELRSSSAGVRVACHFFEKLPSAPTVGGAHRT